MKTTLFLTCLFISGCISAQTLNGAWKMTHQNGNEVNDVEYIKILQDNYFAFGAVQHSDNHFIAAGGGPYSLDAGTYIETLDFFTLDPTVVGISTPFQLDLVNGKMVISSNTKNGILVEIWEKVSEDEDALTRNWVFTGRKQGEEIIKSTPGARRTVKILSGGRFQWIAFNSETKEFSGTGGGTYTAKDGKYVEKITFFSRDDNRVGAELSFDFEVIDGEWHHNGLSSKGDPIYEIWTPYKIAYKGK